MKVSWAHHAGEKDLHSGSARDRWRGARVVAARRGVFGAISIELMVVAPNTANTFQASRTLKIAHQIRPGRPGRSGVAPESLGPVLGGSGGEGKLKTTLQPFAGGLGYDRSGACKRIRRHAE